MRPKPPPHVAWYALAITAGSYLLFAVQPMMGKVILPWYGGSTSVWTACLLFFQALLFAGYLYAHLLRTLLPLRGQAVLHGLLIAATLLLLPLAVEEGWQGTFGEIPSLAIMIFLGATVGLPYLVLSAGSPLLQAWASEDVTVRPYRLYAFSNAGSLAGLLSYPFAVEPLMDLSRQSLSWSVFYGLYALCCFVLMFTLMKARGVSAGRRTEPEEAEDMAAGDRGMIFTLALCGSLVMAATTHAICEDIAVIPLLWIVPLAIYIVSFIVLFAWESVYRRGVFLPLLGLTTVGAVTALYLGIRLEPLPRIFLLASFLFSACFTCHGELVRLKPHHGRLTFFYLLLSAGGAFGTFLVIFAAPALFAGFWEFHCGIFLCWALVLAALYREGSAGKRVWAFSLVSIVALVGVLRFHVLVEMGGVIAASRNFYGVLRVVEARAEDPVSHRIELVNGGVLHGSQFQAAKRRSVATAYYGRHSGLAMAIRGQREHQRSVGAGTGLRVGVVGLGVGVIASYAVRGDELVFYEINPAVEEAARTHFTFLEDSDGEIKVRTGDARLVLEQEGREGRERYDILVVDAFSGDAIPVHLLTQECMEVYFERLKPAGRLAFNISNRYLDLRPLLAGLAGASGAEVIIIDTLGRLEEGTRGATWAILAREGALFSSAERAAAAGSRPLPGGSILWTDSYSNLFSLLAGGSRKHDSLTLPPPGKTIDGDAGKSRVRVTE